MSDETHPEAASVTITRLVCQLVVTVSVLGAALLLVLTHPEYNAGVALVCGVVLGTWFVMPDRPRWTRHRRKEREED
jgi:hypothetical protein